MKKNDYVYTPRFCTVRIEKIFASEEEARQEGYTEPTYYDDPDYGIAGKSLDMYHMKFAGYRK